MINTSCNKEYSHLGQVTEIKKGKNSWRVSEIVTYLNTFWVTHEPGITVNLVL